jgi:hypothetical protein
VLESWYNAWRPHMTLEGLRPDDLYYSRKPETPDRKAKTVPGNIERYVFRETRLTVCLSSTNGTAGGVRLSSYITSIYVPKLRSGILPPPKAIMSLELGAVALRGIGRGTTAENNGLIIRSSISPQRPRSH